MVLAPDGAKDFQGGGDNGEAEEVPASSSKVESRFQGAEDDDMSGGEDESENASKDQPEVPRTESLAVEGKEARPNPPTPRTMAIQLANGRQTRRRRPSAGQSA